METQGQRITRIRKAEGLTQSRLGQLAGISGSAISSIEREETKTIQAEHIFKIARALRRNAEWLVTGKGPEMTGTGNTGSGPAIAACVPLISWVAAGNWAAIEDHHLPGEGEALIPTTKKVGPSAFCLRVRGDSMVAPGGHKSYPDGSLIIVDPDATLINGAPAVVRLDDSEEATFKVYVEDAGKKYLKPLNPQYPMLPVNGAATICGVVVQTIIDE